MKVSIITCPRPDGVDTLGATVASCLDSRSGVEKNDEFRVFSDSLEAPSSAGGLPVVTRTPEDLAFVRSRKAIGTYNFLRSLEWGKADDDGALCIFEDDIELSKGWRTKLGRLCEAAQRAFGFRWLLSLIHFYQLRDFAKVEQVGPVGLMRWLHPGGFYGSQALCMPSRLAGEFYECLRLATTSSDSRIRGEYRSDMAIKPFVIRFHVPLLACHPCLVQHVDGPSTWLAAGKRVLRCRYYDADSGYQAIDSRLTAAVPSRRGLHRGASRRRRL